MRASSKKPVPVLRPAAPRRRGRTDARSQDGDEPYWNLLRAVFAPQSAETPTRAASGSPATPRARAA